MRILLALLLAWLAAGCTAMTDRSEAYDPWEGMNRKTFAFNDALDLNGRAETPGHDGHGTNVFGAIRLRNGHTLIAGGNNNRVLEVTPAGKVFGPLPPDLH